MRVHLIEKIVVPKYLRALVDFIKDEEQTSAQFIEGVLKEFVKTKTPKDLDTQYICYKKKIDATIESLERKLLENSKEGKLSQADSTKINLTLYTTVEKVKVPYEFINYVRKLVNPTYLKEITEDQLLTFVPHCISGVLNSYQIPNNRT